MALWHLVLSSAIKAYEYDAIFPDSLGKLDCRGSGKSRVNVALDSSVLIELANENDPHHFHCVKAFNSKPHTFLASAIAVVEALVATYVKDYELAFKARLSLEERVSGFVEITMVVAYEALELMHRTSLKLADAIICASAESSSAELWTCDKDLVRQFPAARYVGL